MLTVSTQIAPEDDLQFFSRMLDSVAFADEFLIYSFARRDRELTALAKQYRAKLVALEQPLPKIVEFIRTRQVQEATGDWVLVMDFDEVVTPELAQNIRRTVRHASGTAGAYSFYRRNFSLGWALRHGGWGDDAVIRLFPKAQFADWPTDIHSTPKVKGNIVHLDGYMEHHKDATLSQMVAKTDRYSQIEAKQFFAGGLPPVSAFTLARKSGMEFVRRYFLKKGFLDGRIGLIQSLYQAFSVFISYAKLFELQQLPDKPKSASNLSKPKSHPTL